MGDFVLFCKIGKRSTLGRMLAREDARRLEAEAVEDRPWPVWEVVAELFWVVKDMEARLLDIAEML